MKKILFVTYLMCISIISFSVNLDLIDEIENNVNYSFINKNIKFKSDTGNEISNNLKFIDEMAVLNKYILHLLKYDLTDEDIESIEFIYQENTEEMKRYSEDLSVALLKDPKKIDKYITFMSKLKHEDFYGFYYLNNALLKGLNRDNREFFNILERISDIIIESEEYQNRIFGIDIKKYIQEFGIKVSEIYSKEISRFIEKKDTKRYSRNKKYIKKAFDLFRYLNRKLSRARDIPDYEKILNEANALNSSGNYRGAIGLYKQLLSQYYSYGINNSVNYEIGSCYKALSEKENAVLWYKKSILEDVDIAYKRYSFSDVLDLYVFPNCEENDLLQAINFLKWCIKESNDSYIVQYSYNEKSELYLNCSNIDGIEVEKYEEYRLLAVESYEEYIKNHISVTDELPVKDELYIKISDIYSNMGLKNEFALDKKENYLNKSINICKYIIENIKNIDVIENAYNNITLNYWFCGGSYYIYNKEKSRFYFENGIKYGKEQVELFEKSQNIDFYLYNLANNLKFCADTYFFDDKAEYKEIINDLTECNKYLDKMRADGYYTVSFVNNYKAVNNYMMGKTIEYYEKDDEKALLYFKLSERDHLKVINSEKSDKFEKIAAYTNIVNTYRSLGDYDKGIWACNKVVENTDYYADYYTQAGIYVQLGTMYLLKEDNEKAREIFNNVNTYYPNSGVNSKSDMGIGDSYKNVKDYENAEKSYLKVIEDPFYNNFNIILHQEKIRAYKELIEIYHETKKYKEERMLIEEVLGLYNDSGYYYNDDFVEESKKIYSNTVKVKIDPVIEEMQEGETKRLTAELVYPDNSKVDISGFENLRWSWSITGNTDDVYELNVLSENSNTADLTLIKGNFMDIIVTANVEFEVPDISNSRTVSRKFTLGGDNQVPIMIVNEDDRRIKDIPMINPDNLEGIGMGESPYASDPVHGTFKFLTEYTDNKKDEIDAIILDPNYSLSHHVILKETEKDSRIFATEIPEENLDDDPENDVSYDSFEIKVNYPLPYPQILGSGMRNMDYGTRENQEQKAEFEYLKKNGEYLNDFDQDEEIEEKERLQFPIWQGPDYENNDKKAYLMSNMIFEDGTCKSDDQEKYITKDSKFKIKVIPDEGETRIGSATIVTLVVLGTALTYDVCLSLNHENNYISEDLYIVSSDSSGLISEDGNYYKEIDGKIFQVIPIENISDVKLKIMKDDEEINCISENLVYSTYGLSFYNRIQIFDFNKNQFTESIANLTEAGYTNVVDKSPTAKEIFSILKNNYLKIFYFTGHANFVKSQMNPNFPGMGVLSVNETKEGNFDDKYDSELDEDEIKNENLKGPEILILNVCNKSKGPEFLVQMKDAFNANNVIGWNDVTKANYALSFFKSFFGHLNKLKKKKSISWEKLKKDYEDNYGKNETKNLIVVGGDFEL